jgi:hypothetical protein
MPARLKDTKYGVHRWDRSRSGLRFVGWATDDPEFPPDQPAEPVVLETLPDGSEVIEAGGEAPPIIAGPKPAKKKK